MSNKYLIPLIVAISISTIVAVSVNQFNKSSNNKVAIVSSSNVVVTQSSLSQLSSTSSQIVSISSSVQVQSSLLPIFSSTLKVVESKVVESVKTTSQKLSETITECSLPESENLMIKNKYGCFGYINWDPGSLNELPSKLKILELTDKITNDYYLKIKDKFVADKKIVNILYYKIISENEIETFLSMHDFEVYKQMYPSFTGQGGGPLNIKEAKYKILLSPKNNEWSFEFVQFEPQN